MHGLNSEIVKALVLAIPPRSEQRAIIRFLDHVDHRIRRHIRAKQKLIAVLEEHKHLVIHRAVTGDFNVGSGKPYSEYQDPGIPWLGKIPRHWGIPRIGSFAKVGNGSTPSRGNAGYWSSGRHPWLTSSSVNKGFISEADQFVTDLALRECHLPMVKAGSVLVGITGQGKTRGMGAVLGLDATINQHIAYITPNTPRASPDYVQLFLTAAYTELRAISGASGSTRAALTCEDIGRFRVAMPPLEEQLQLLSALKQHLTRVDSSLAHVRRGIALATAYRDRLIADVVTGKLAIREAAANLPDLHPLAASDETTESREARYAPAADHEEALSELAG